MVPIYPSICTYIQGMNYELPIMIDVNCRRKCDNLHFHNYTQICYVLAGNANFTIGDATHNLQPGECAIAFPYVPHNLNTTVSEDTPITVMISFQDTFLTDRGVEFFSHSKQYAQFEKKKLPKFKIPDAETKTKTSYLIREIIAEFSRHFDMSFDQLADYLVDFLKLICTEDASLPDENSYTHAKERAYAISDSIKYMAEHYNEKISVEKLASIATMSRSIYMETFKQTTGMSPIKFLNGVRVVQARGALVTSNLSISEIANNVGFYDKSRLIHAFNEFFGISPLAMKNAFPQSMYDTYENSKRRWSWMMENKDE